MNSSRQKLLKLSTEKLIDVVKNYRQYSYDESIKNTALEILNERGYDQELLSKSGNIENQNYQFAFNIFSSFNRYSLIAIFLFIILILVSIFFSLNSNESRAIIMVEFIASLGILALYILFLVKSFMDQNQLNKILAEDDVSESIVLFLVIGAPFYIFYYFYLRKRLKEQIEMVKS